MLTRRRFVINSVKSLALGLPIAGLLGCERASLLRVGVHPWIGYEPLYLAEELRLLPKHVALVKGHNASESVQRLMAGKIDAVALTLDEVLRVRGQGIALTVVQVFDSSAGADMVLSKPEIKSLAALKGQRIGYEANALGELMRVKLLSAAGLHSDQITWVNLPPNFQVQAWKDNQVDAVITYEPTATELKTLGASVLFNSRQIPETIFDVLAIKTDSLPRFDSQLKALIQANFQALYHLNTNLGDSLYRIANHENIDPQAVQSALREVVLPSLATNRSYLTKNSSFYRAAKTLNSIMFEQHLLPKLDDFSELFSSQYLPERVL